MLYEVITIASRAKEDGIVFDPRPAFIAYAGLFLMGFSLLSMLEFLIRETETCEIINHPLCGCATEVIQKNHLSVKIELFKLLY